MKWSKFIIFLIFLFLLPVQSYSGELDKPYSPTRKEWLQSSIFQHIKTRTDPWKQRISSIVWIKEKENTVFITLTSANGQEPLPKESTQNYVEIIKKDVETLLKEHDWSKELQVFVQFI